MRSDFEFLELSVVLRSSTSNDWGKVSRSEKSIRNVITTPHYHDINSI